MPAAFTFARNSRTSAAGSSRPRHWLAFLAKICKASQRWATARSTARGSPPATDMCAPSRGISRETHYNERRSTPSRDRRGETRCPITLHERWIDDVTIIDLEGRMSVEDGADTFRDAVRQLIRQGRVK